MDAHFELFDHTADIGVRSRAPTLPGLVAPATDGLYAVIGDVLTTGSGDARTFEFADDEPALLLRDYLAELLHLFDTRKQRVTDLDVREFSADRLVVTARACPIDERRSRLHREIKAVTYHELALRPAADGYEATYIVDI